MSQTFPTLPILVFFCQQELRIRPKHRIYHHKKQDQSETTKIEISQTLKLSPNCVGIAPPQYRNFVQILPNFCCFCVLIGSGCGHKGMGMRGLSLWDKFSGNILNKNERLPKKGHIARQDDEKNWQNVARGLLHRIEYE